MYNFLNDYLSLQRPMKQIVLGILFSLTIICVWNMVGEYCVSPEVVKEPAEAETCRAANHEGQIISVLTAANSCADVSVRTTTNFSPSFARRYRPAGFSFDKLFEHLCDGQGSVFDTTFKTTTGLSQEYAARLKNAGYYIYTLRKIIV